MNDPNRTLKNSNPCPYTPGKAWWQEDVEDDTADNSDLYVINVLGPRGGQCGWAVVNGLEAVDMFKDEHRGRRFYKGIATTFEVIPHRSLHLADSREVRTGKCKNLANSELYYASNHGSYNWWQS